MCLRRIGCPSILRRRRARRRGAAGEPGPMSRYLGAWSFYFPQLSALSVPGLGSSRCLALDRGCCMGTPRVLGSYSPPRTSRSWASKLWGRKQASKQASKPTWRKGVSPHNLLPVSRLFGLPNPPSPSNPPEPLGQGSRMWLPGTPNPPRGEYRGVRAVACRRWCCRLLPAPGTPAAAPRRLWGVGGLRMGSSYTAMAWTYHQHSTIVAAHIVLRPMEGHGRANKFPAVHWPLGISIRECCAVSRP
ncbi:hypothetical protein F4780DRAFT_536326 [Xylariomycetidae sp. FL0641]|nr:hypothetical protein F4780DRAFT_536326 [Xylariomycetidae sp. FL0641]